MNNVEKDENVGCTPEPIFHGDPNTEIINVFSPELHLLLPVVYWALSTPISIR